MERLIVYRFKYFDARKRRYVQTDQLATREAIARMGWRELPDTGIAVSAAHVDETGVITPHADAQRSAVAEAAH